MTTKHRGLLIGGGCALLLLLNFQLDLRRTLANLSWEPVRRQTLHRTVVSDGVLEANRVETLKSEVNETVETKAVREGQRVVKNQPLIQLSQIQTKIEYQQKKNTLLNAESDLRRAEREVEVQKKLLRSRAVSRNQVEDAELNLVKVRSNYDILKQEFSLTAKKLEGTLVRAPFSGVILKDMTTVDMPVTPGKDLLMVGDISKFIVRTKVDELDIQQVKIGKPVEIYADAYSGHVLKGVVRSIATQAERDVFAKVEVQIEITNAAGLDLKHNLTVRTHILTDDIPNALGVSSTAVQKKKGDTGWVTVRNRLGLVREKRVALGTLAGELIEIRAGLKEGDIVGVPKPIGVQ